MPLVRTAGLALFALATAVARPGASPQRGELLRLERSVDAMGTTFSVAVYGADRFGLDAILDQAFEEVLRLDDLLSNYKPESEWSQINRQANGGPFPVSQEVFDLLTQCVEYSRASQGAFDITVGPLMKVWGFYKGTGRLPHRAQIRDAMARVGWRYIQLDPVQRTVHFTRRGLEIDPGGIGKGYAVDRIAGILRHRGVTSGLIYAGRSSIYAIGAPPSEPRGWRVAIPDPRRPSRDVFEVFLKNESMSTSGSTERFFYASGHRYSHLMDPRTGFPVQGMLSVSVVAPKTIDSEAWTKPFFVLGREWTARNKPNNFRVFLCEDLPEKPCVSLP